MKKAMLMSESALEQIDYFVSKGGRLLFYGVSRDEDEWIVLEHSGFGFALRNQGEHDRRFFLIRMCKPEKALEIIHRHCK